MAETEVQTQTLDEQTERDLAVASQWQLVWLRFRRHKLAMAGAAVLLVFYFVAAFCEILAPYTPDTRHAEHVHAPPQRIHFFDQDGTFHLRPFVYGLTFAESDGAWARDYVKDPSRKYPIELFPRGPEYSMWGLFTWDRHLFGAGGGPLYLFGTDELGRDLFTRILYGARISLTIGLVGVGMTFFIGILLGGLAGYFGGMVDNAVQRLIEVLICIPQLPLWMVLSASLPAEWSPLAVYFGITVILSFIGWTNLARVVRGKFLSLRDEDFVVAAELCGTNRITIIFRHLLPSFLSHVITAMTLAVPQMILGETALSFLGIGLRPPVVSWGVLLEKAQNFQAVVMAPWLLLPGVFVIVVVLAFNLVGDGMRDAADPYSVK